MSVARIVIVAAVALSGWRAFAQATVAPTNDLPNPYQTGIEFGQLPPGRKMGATASVWTACGTLKSSIFR